MLVEWKIAQINDKDCLKVVIKKNICCDTVLFFVYALNCACKKRVAVVESLSVHTRFYFSYNRFSEGGLVRACYNSSFSLHLRQNILF